MAKPRSTARLRGHENDRKGPGDNPFAHNGSIRPVDEEGNGGAFDTPIPDKDKRSIQPVEGKRASYNPFTDKGRGPFQAVDEDEEGNEPVELLPVGDEEEKVCRIPGALYGFLKPHQRQGLQWLWRIHCNYSGGIVADDMGLGKTLQIAVFLSSLLHADIIQRGLIIAPVSVLSSWSQELRKAGLDNNFQIYNNSGEKGLQTVNKEGGFLVTSYEMYGRNKLTLMKSQWNYVVIDEAHKLKNLDAQVREAIDGVKCKKKILMTGTPVTRNIFDIFSLMQFINPDVLGKEQSFRKEYMGPVEMGQYLDSTLSEKRNCLKALVRCKNKVCPYMLRRTKSVLIETGELPCTKHDIIVWLRLTEFQAELYSKLCKIYDLESHTLSVGEKSAYTQKTLGQHICNAPDILLNILDDGGSSSVRRLARRLVSTMDDEAFRNLKNSCKISFILDLLNELFEQEKTEIAEGVQKKKNMKILMFSQSIYMLDRIQAALAPVMKEGDIIRVDGSMARTERDAKIEQFRSEDGPRIFLLSARVGGEGLNLTAATRVIIIDPSWNISDDNQIADRVYRIGQDQDVTIYRLFTCKTIEEYVYKTQLVKGSLAQAVLEGKLCSPLVKKKDGRMLRLPKSGFNSSETQERLASMIGNVLGVNKKHENFLRTHYLVAGLSNQDNVFSHEQIPVPDHIESSDEDGSDSEPEESAKFGGHVVSSSYKLRELHRSKQKGYKRIQVPTNKVRVLIGMDGATLGRIKTLSSAIITLNHNSVDIRGTPKEIQRAEELITHIISKAADTVEIHFPVPEDKVGLIIGKHGRKVQELELNSGASISQVKRGIFRIRGSQGACDQAAKLISETINKAGSASGTHGSHQGSGVMAQLPYRPPRTAMAPPGFSAGCSGGRAFEHGHRPAVQMAVQQPQSAVQEPPQQVPSPGVSCEYYGERGESYRGYYYAQVRNGTDQGQGVHRTRRHRDTNFKD